jgi:DNA recombination protein RmuC
MNILFLIIGIIIGGITVWFISTNKLRAEYSAKINEVDSQARGNENTITELRKQLADKTAESADMNRKYIFENSLKVKAETQLDEAKKNLDEQKKLLEEATNRLKETFNSLSSEALKSNNKAFLDLAKTTLETYLTSAQGDLAKRQAVISETLKPIKESLENYEKNLKEIEKTRLTAYGDIKNYLDGLKLSQDGLQKETNALVTALKTSQVRGKYGEIGLRRVVEFAGMNDYCDFEEQVSVTTEDGRLRPDMIVKLPGNRRVIVDSKVPLAAYMQAFETTDEKIKNEFLVSHSKAVREHLKDLSTKAYWSQFTDTPDFVVLYMQIESSFGAALEFDRNLIEDGISNRIIFATPTTIITLLRTVAFSWQQEKISENAQKIQEVGVELYNRISTLVEHISRVGDNLKSAVDNYNKAVGSIETRFIPHAKKLKELGAADQNKELSELQPVDRTIRTINNEQ